MKCLLVVQLLQCLLTNLIKLNKFLENISQKSRLLTCLSVLITNHSLSHKMMQVIFLLQLVIVNLRTNEKWFLLVVKTLSQLIHIFIKSYIGILRTNNHLISPNHIIPVNRSFHLLFYVLNQMLSCFVLVEQNVDLFSKRVFVFMTKFINTCFYVIVVLLFTVLVYITTLKHS